MLRIATPAHVGGGGGGAGLIGRVEGVSHGAIGVGAHQHPFGNAAQLAPAPAPDPGLGLINDDFGDVSLTELMMLEELLLPAERAGEPRMHAGPGRP